MPTLSAALPLWYEETADLPKVRLNISHRDQIVITKDYKVSYMYSPLTTQEHFSTAKEVSS
jgi:hypothetical protein